MALLSITPHNLHGRHVIISCRKLKVRRLSLFHRNNVHREFRQIRSAESEVEVEDKRTGRHTHGHGHGHGYGHGHGHGQHGYLMKLLFSFEGRKVG
jgi:hypothetical protein